MSEKTSPLSIYPEPTPNPATMKFITNRTLIEKGSADFPDAKSSEKSPLAEKLFQIPGVEGVFIGGDFLTLTKNEFGAWNNVADLAMDGIRVFLEEGGSVLSADYQFTEVNDGETAAQVRALLDKEIRPALAMDGGDVTFVDYRDGVVSLKMIGACSGCPSSSMTLKMGIERRLQEEFPEIVAVEAV